MPEVRPLDLLEPPKRFLRSVHLERDFEDPGALNGYVVTPPLREALERVAEGLKPGSTRRAWRVTGDFGSGKSSFGLALARLVAPEPDDLPPVLAQIRESLADPGLLPVLVTGSRDRLSRAVLRGLRRALERARDGGRTPQVIKDTDAALERAGGGGPTKSSLRKQNSFSPATNVMTSLMAGSSRRSPTLPSASAASRRA